MFKKVVIKKLVYKQLQDKKKLLLLYIFKSFTTIINNNLKGLQKDFYIIFFQKLSAQALEIIRICISYRILIKSIKALSWETLSIELLNIY